MFEPIWPEYRGADITAGNLLIDSNNISKGYFLAAADKYTDKKLKLRLTKDGNILTYDLNSDGLFETFPLQFGNGNYSISLCRNVYSNRYAYAGSTTLKVNLENSCVPFLSPNKVVNYARDSAVVETADGICAGKSDKQMYAAVKDFMKQNFVYDFIKAIKIIPNMLPDIDEAFKSRSGMCFDLAAITAAMLRSQGIPSKLAVGYAGRQYHAWTINFVNGRWYRYDPTLALNAINSGKTYTAERIY